MAVHPSGTAAKKSETESKREQSGKIQAPGMVMNNLTEAEMDTLDDQDILDVDLMDSEPETSATEPEDLAEAQEKPEQPPKVPAKAVSSSIFRAYDIRGIVGDTLDTDIAYRVGQAVGSEASAQNEKSVVVGADGRLSSPELSAALIQGIRDSGLDAINVGMVPTPLVYYATHNLDTKSGVMITGSHNPADYNGFKIVIAGQTLANEQIQDLYRRISENDFTSGHGALDDVDVVEHYLARVSTDIAIAKPLKVVVDCGNGVAGAIAPRLFEELGCDVIPLYCEIDGRFPNHHPDPGKPENLQDVIAAVAEHDADIGLAFDGDGDRVGVVTNSGQIIFPDRLMMLFAKDVTQRNPGADIIFDVKCSRRLAGLISNYGGRPIMWKTGHSLIKAKMKETGALLAGEMSGHIFFKERWFGFDDGLYSGARLLEILGAEERDAQTLFDSFPDDVSTPEINIEVSDETKFQLVEQLQQTASFDNAETTTIDGLRVDFEEGWGLVRASNTTPVLVLRFGAKDEDTLTSIQQQFRQLLQEVDSGLAIPF